MNYLFKTDYEQKMKRPFSTMGAIRAIIVYHDMHYLWLLRKASIARGGGYRKILQIMVRVYGRKYGLEISPNAKIGMFFELGHPFGITINGNAELGKFVTIGKGATIGKVETGKRQGSPKIGNKVVIGINSTIVGNCTIGNNVMICANSFVDFDVPDNSIVLGNPGILHRKDNPTYGYFYEQRG